MSLGWPPTTPEPTKAVHASMTATPACRSAQIVMIFTSFFSVMATMSSSGVSPARIHFSGPLLECLRLAEIRHDDVAPEFLAQGGPERKRGRLLTMNHKGPPRYSVE